MDTLISRVAVRLAVLLVSVCATAQELTPGAYWPRPVGVNILTFVNRFNKGDVTSIRRCLSTMAAPPSTPPRWRGPPSTA